ncbi:phage terminase large subunit [Variibacter gotjawalensis]|nr:phage terminase large subunit [Variibacter gotjawalensis]RZS49621.1 putative phage terminase large subunit-like protein [Variibacter gotjawalensis]
MIKRKWLQRYDDVPLAKHKFILQSWDTASKEGGANDWSVCTTWSIVNNRFYLLDVTRQRVSYTELRRLAAKLHRYSGSHQVLIEEAGIGYGLLDDLQSQGIPVRGVRPEGDKIVRLALQSPKFEAGLVYLPRQASWLADFEAELLSFPGGRNDDQVDSTTQALANYESPFANANITRVMQSIMSGMSREY